MKSGNLIIHTNTLSSILQILRATNNAMLMVAIVVRTINDLFQGTPGFEKISLCIYIFVELCILHQFCMTKQSTMACVVQRGEK